MLLEIIKKDILNDSYMTYIRHVYGSGQLRHFKVQFNMIINDSENIEECQLLLNDYFKDKKIEDYSVTCNLSLYHGIPTFYYLLD
jgi:hypothetical protein